MNCIVFCVYGYYFGCIDVGVLLNYRCVVVLDDYLCSSCFLWQIFVLSLGFSVVFLCFAVL